MEVNHTDPSLRQGFRGYTLAYFASPLTTEKNKVFFNTDTSNSSSMKLCSNAASSSS